MENCLLSHSKWRERIIFIRTYMNHHDNNNYNIIKMIDDNVAGFEYVNVPANFSS
jgi:hypothetical protein